MSAIGCHPHHDFDLECDACVRELLGQAHATACQLTSSTADAEDVAGDAILAAVASTRRGSGWRRGFGGSLRTWTDRVTHHTFISERRREQRHRRRAERASRERLPSAEALAEMEYVRAIEAYLETIPPKEALGVRLAVFDEYNRVELAGALGMTPQRWGQIVTKHVQRIAAILRKAED